MFTPAQAIEAIKARINEEWNNPQLRKLGALWSDTLEDLKQIVANTNTEPVVSVLFVKETTPDNILAVFPLEAQNNNLIICYSHIGQHSAASKEYVKELKEASPEDYKSLQDELTSLGYSLNILNGTVYKL